jgi:hypothetical protein
MKKIKIMLLSLLILAVFAGALAFKAKTYGLLYCIGTTDLGINFDMTCTQTRIIISHYNPTAPRFFFTTLQADGISPITNSADCPSGPCPSTSLGEGER